MTEECASRDLVRNRAAMPLLWLLPTVAILVAGGFAENRWIITPTWTGSLLVMGTACLLNASGCGRIHCFFTGPFFLAMAGVSLAFGLQFLPLGPNGWQHILAALLVGGVVFLFVPEWLWGRYRRTQQKGAT